MSEKSLPSEEQPARRWKVSGSEKRQRGKGAVSVRLLPEERAALELKAGEAGLSLAAYLRAKGLGAPGARFQRAPSVEVLALAPVLAQLGRVGSNLNQIAKALNASGVYDAREASEVLAQVQEAADAIVEVLGRRRRR